MDLKDFVKITIEQIVEGTALAQASIKEHGGIVNPTSMNFFKDGQRSIYDHAMPQEVKFDVGLTSTDKSGSSEGIGVFLGSISLGKKMIQPLSKWLKPKFNLPFLSYFLLVKSLVGNSLGSSYNNAIKHRATKRRCTGLAIAHRLLRR